MPKPRPGNDDPGKSKRSPLAAGWARLTWSDLEDWAGTRSVERGRTYQRGGRVKGLKTLGDSALLARVVGTERYATMVELIPGGSRPSLESTCTCPIGDRCKHAIAVVADYLQAVADGRKLPVAAEGDPLLDELEAGGPFDDDHDDDGGWDEEVEEIPARAARDSRRSTRAEANPAGWDARIERHIRAKSQAELADLAWSLTRRFPEVYREFRERITLQGGDVARLVAEARREIREVTSEPAWRGYRKDEGYTPDYGRIRSRFERLLELGHADPVVSLGREFIELGLVQLGQSHDEGESSMAFAACLPAVFEALMASSLSGPERILFAIDAELADEYDAVGEATEPVLEADWPPDAWSEVADTLAGRLEPAGGAGAAGVGAEWVVRDYQRGYITGWIASALRRAGRDGEVRALYESEARGSGSYERIVEYLLEAGQLEDAERWAKEGIAATLAKLPGISEHLAEKLRTLAERREQWDVVAAHAARKFFEGPGLTTFDDLIQAAGRANVEGPVRAVALKFLETGVGPFHPIAPPVPTPSIPRGKPAAGKKPPKAPLHAPSPAPAPRSKIDRAWPLPVPGYLVPLMARKRPFDEGPHPHYHVLLEMAIAAKEPDEVLRWYDKLRIQPASPASITVPRPMPTGSPSRSRRRTRSGRSRSTPPRSKPSSRTPRSPPTRPPPATWKSSGRSTTPSAGPASGSTSSPRSGRSTATAPASWSSSPASTAGRSSTRRGPGAGDPAAAHQTRRTGYASKAGSTPMIGTPSTIACAIRRRSKGSLWRVGKGIEARWIRWAGSMGRVRNPPGLKNWPRKSS